MNNLDDVMEKLESTKAKDRQEGVVAIREVFSKDNVVETFHINQDEKSVPKVWIPIFKSLFKNVSLEMEPTIKKSGKKSASTPAALKRISEAVSCVRWLIERVVPYMNGKVFKACFSQLMTTLRCAGDLFGTIALDYTKALRCMLSFPPHLQHLEDDMWVDVVKMGFNIILGKPINMRLDVDGEDEELASDVDSDMYMAEDAEDDDLPSTVAGKGRKRSRRDPTPIPILSPRKSQKQTKSRRNVLISVSLEQIEFASVLRTLLGSSTAPILLPNYPKLPSAILQRLQQFLELYPVDSSLLHDYIYILSSTLSHLSLNRKHEVEKFARSTWDGLIGLWGTKDRRLKEGLLVVLRHLFQFVICPTHTEQKLPFFDHAEGLGRLWHLLSGEAENRWGVDGLSLDSLRLEIMDPSAGASCENETAFVAKTFRSGWNFDAGQALSWAILELQADCTGKLFQLSEQMHPPPASGTSRTATKRVKLENPIISVLHSIETSTASHVRAYHLQTLLFFIDRHWSLVHDSLKHDIIHVLLQYVAYDDAAIQSWVFLNFAAIAYDEGSKSFRRSADVLNTLNSSIWDSIWTHAIRRANAPGICRAACHAGHALLDSLQSHNKTSQGLVTFHRVLLEIETLVKDMDVQGPSYPFDSVCIFLSQCLTIASQDVRLYRMHLEDKVLSWFVDSWKISGNRMKMAPHTVGDILLLLETLCGLSKRVDITAQPLLPPSEIVDSMIEENKVKIIRDFLLYAKLPPFNSKSDSQSKPSAQARGATGPNGNNANAFDKSQLVAPRGRERKVSSFFQKTLESLVAEWEFLKDSHPTAETARRSLDIAITAIAFESLLVLNGTATNRFVLQGAAKIVSILTPFLADSRWTTAERLIVVQAFEILIPNEDYSQGGTFREALSRPGRGSGIKEQTLQNLIIDHVVEESRRIDQINFLRLIWQIADVQDALGPVINTLRAVLRQIFGVMSSEQLMDTDDNDGFAPTRSTALQSSMANTRKVHDDQTTRRVLQICISFLTSGPFLQSSSGERTRDKDLAEMISGSAQNPDMFCAASPFFFQQVRQGTVDLPLKDVNMFFKKFGQLLTQYMYTRNEHFLQVLIDVLLSTLGLWRETEPLANEVHAKFQSLSLHLTDAYDEGRCRSWAMRDALAVFLGRYLSADPTQESWVDNPEDFAECLPTAILPRLNDDPDIRVRFRVAVINTGLFPIVRHTGRTPLQLYEVMRKSYTVDLDEYEHMLTRMLALGNIMVVSSAVRQGPYWHLLEACLYSSIYSTHIEVILTAVAERLGMPSLSVLFETYASQLAYSIRKADADFLRFPPHLLGYRDRKQCAEATFRAFTPTNILTDGEQLVKTHCRVLQRDLSEGLQCCFGDIVGSHITFWIDKNPKLPKDNLELLKQKMSAVEDFDNVFQRNVDGIVTSILRSLGDQDISDDSPILSALRTFDPSRKMAHTFQSLTCYRKSDAFESHKPNLPAYSTQVILQSLSWLLACVYDGFTKATTYHVLQELMKDLQRTPLVNEQNRLINAISLWIAYRQQDFEDFTLLHTLTHGATLLLSQLDLARSAQSILAWTLKRYKRGSVKDLRLPNILIRICCTAHDYSSDVFNPTISQMGKELLEWIDERVIDFSESSTLRSLILRALPAWPHQPSAGLLSLYNEITSYNISSVLEDHRIASNKFRLVRRLQERAMEHDLDENQFSNSYFWRLKECMPPPDRLQNEDVRAFVELLTLNHGQIGSLNMDQTNLNSPRPRQIRMAKKKQLDNTFTARDAITLGLLAMLGGDDPSQVSNAYNTLRLIMAVSSEGNCQLQLPADYQKELDFLKTYRQSPATRPSKDIQDMLNSEIYRESSSNFPQWIRLVAILLSDTLASIDPFFGQLAAILESDVTFADQILPILVHTILQVERAENSATYPRRTLLSNYFSIILSSTITDISCVRSIVDIVLHLRYFGSRQTDALAHDKWLEVDFRLLARSAILCGAYTTALLFLELAAEHNLQSPDAETTTEQVLYEIYSHIDEPDGFYGINTKDLHQFLIKRFHHEKQWDKAFRFHGAALEAGSSHGGEQEGLLESFHFFGFDHLAIDTLRNSRESSSDRYPSSMNYKLGWRTETWDLPDQSTDAASAPLYRSLRAIYRERDPRILENTIQLALYEEMGHLRSLGSENMAEVRSVSQDLMCLSEILRWRQDPVQTLLKPENISMNNWGEFVNIDARFDFSDLESLMATRISLVRSVRQREERRQIGSFVTTFVRGLVDIERKCLLRLSEAARTSGQIQIALNSVVRAQRLNLDPSLEVSEEYANVLWVQKEEKPAVQFLQEVISKANVTNDCQQLPRQARLLSRLGTWTSEACLEKPTDIWERYFSPSIALLDKVKVNSADLDATKATIYRECAMFAERQYHASLQSPDALRWKVYVDRKKKEIEDLNNELRRPQAASVKQKLKSEQDKAQKLFNEDSELFRKHNVLLETFLKQAIEMHSRCLEISSSFDEDSAIRFCSLWFANFDDESILDSVRQALERIPSRKLVFLAHQLTARVSNPPSPHMPRNQDNLQSLVTRMCQEHPFHSLYQLYCLSDHSKASENGRQSQRHSQSTQTERGTAASNILDRLRNDQITRARVRDIERLCDAYLEWAEHPIAHDQTYKIKPKDQFKIPTTLKILQISNMKVPVSTIHLPLDPTLQYKDFVSIARYSPLFDTAGGVNMPKICICHGSDGRQYKQLFKGEGNDDLRQDAVMEQVFDLVNSILKRNRETRRRELGVRDYKVIPLSSHAGLLEFVGNTSPLRDWLLKAHTQYHPEDVKSGAFQDILKNAQKNYRDRPDKVLSVFLEMRKKFKPVMRHYFTEKHRNPMTWFQMRLKYTRSVATTSIVGHVLGLGDRHVSNILLDNVSGEIVHIDLGIAFDQGKLLPVPERVPFRMTADIVDGMGTSGTAGVFQRCAEETLRVLREESGVIMTVLEVFKHDPLHSWTASEVKVKQAQSEVTTTVNDTSRYNLGIGIDMSSGSADESADRALSSVARKLDKSLSVESTVNELIAEATDPMNLATIFYGWNPHL